MGQCEVCGNIYKDSIEVKKQGNVHIFDCFECAVHSLAPNCSHCGVKMLGHGIQVGNTYFCCAHCARAKGHKQAVDHLEKEIAL